MNTRLPLDKDPIATQAAETITRKPQEIVDGLRKQIKDSSFSDFDKLTPMLSVLGSALDRMIGVTENIQERKVLTDLNKQLSDGVRLITIRRGDPKVHKDLNHEDLKLISDSNEREFVHFQNILLQIVEKLWSKRTIQKLGEEMNQANSTQESAIPFDDVSEVDPIPFDNVGSQQRMQSPLLRNALPQQDLMRIPEELRKEIDGMKAEISSLRAEVTSLRSQNTPKVTDNNGTDTRGDELVNQDYWNQAELNARRSLNSKYNLTDTLNRNSDLMTQYNNLRQFKSAMPKDEYQRQVDDLFRRINEASVALAMKNVSLPPLSE